MVEEMTLFLSRDDAIIKLIDNINNTIKNKNTVLIPTQLIGTSQEIIITLDQLLKQKKIHKCKLYIDKLIIDVNSVHENYIDYLNKEIQQNIINGDYNPFRSRSQNTTNIIQDNKNLEPGIIIIPSSILQNIDSIHYLYKIINDPENMIIFISNQVNGTIAKGIQDKEKVIEINNNYYNINCKIETNFFNSHSDFNQLNAYISRLKPKLRKILINHGERLKIQNFASLFK